MKMPRVSQTWLVTGISSGLGRDLALQLLERGDRVAGLVRNPDAVDDLVERHGERLWVHRVDLAEGMQTRFAVQEAFRCMGEIDVIVNNAGFGVFGALEELSDDQIKRTLEVNVIASLQVVRAALPYLRGQQSGRIIQMSSYGGQVARAGASLYNASKWCIEGFMEALHEELRPFRIGVTIVEPGGVETDFRSRNAELAVPIEAYDGTPGARTRGLRTAPAGIGDPRKMASLILASADQEDAPRRLVLGSDAHAFICDALSARLAEVEGQRQAARRSDRSPGK
jgi:NAD(P)-dependent dehydrogenase (short-subunit alcohol dehydrogenase family)